MSEYFVSREYIHHQFEAIDIQVRLNLLKDEIWHQLSKVLNSTLTPEQNENTRTPSYVCVMIFNDINRHRILKLMMQLAKEQDMENRQQGGFGYSLPINGVGAMLDGGSLHVHMRLIPRLKPRYENITKPL